MPKHFREPQQWSHGQSPSPGALSGLWPLEATAIPLADLVSFITGTYWLDTNNVAHTFPGAPTMIPPPVLILALTTWNYGRTVGGYGFFYYRNLLARHAQRCPNISGSPKNDPTASPNTVPFFRRIEWALANWNNGRTVGRFGVFYYRNLLARHKQQCPHIPGSPNNDPMASPLPLAHGVGSGLLKFTAEPLANLVSFITGTYWLDTNNDAQTFPGAPTMIPWLICYIFASCQTSLFGRAIAEDS